MTRGHPMLLCHRCDGVLLNMAWLNVLRVGRDQWHVLALLILQTDLPASKQLWPWLNMLKPWILKWPLELSVHHVFKTVVRDDMVVCTLVLD